MLQILRADASTVAEIAGRRRMEGEEADLVVAAVIREVRHSGDAALLAYTERFDGVKLAPGDLRVPGTQLAAALKDLEPGLEEALAVAARSIEEFHRRQLERSWFATGPAGEILGQVVAPLARVGVYVPGGRAAYPSSVLMNVLPAKVAGVPEIVLVTPPGEKGAVDPAVLAAASLAGVTEMYRVGGAQAVAALAYGTESIRPVDKVTGPGNVYVTSAKKQVFGRVGIDMPAGPSEVVVVGDGSAPPSFAALDLIAQAEHDPRAWAVLVTPDGEWARAVRQAVREKTRDLPRREIINAALTGHGVILLTTGLAEALDVAAALAPEHLELLVREPFRWLGRVKGAGAVFLGSQAPVAVGDYLAGPNHVLPTAGAARFCSPLGVYDFLRRTGVVYYTPEALSRDAGTAALLARREGLEAHARAVEERLKALR
ncbi:MAG: histidinol dehydrogenase [Peptococcaceae bacterium]|nr:histidinol dehydrogenase [Peptococcaceae bacterium]